MYTEKEVREIFNEYLTTDITIKEIYRKYHSCLNRLFKEYGCTERKTFRKKRNSNNYEILWDASEITNEMEAYIVGLWMADGTISDSQAKLKLKAGESELELLESLKNYIIPDQEIQYERNKTQAKLVISSTEFVNNLENLGVLRGKTYKIMEIPEMKESLLRHFIRGYFDGDGTVFQDRNYLKANICSIDEKILVKMQSIIEDQGINTRINCEIKEGKEYVCFGKVTSNTKNMFRLFITQQNSILKLRDYLYKDATIFLTRKKEKFFTDNTEVNESFKRARHRNA